MRRLDVISQGRQPKRDFRLPLSKRWRIVARCAAVLVVAVALGVTGLLRHETKAASGTGPTWTPPAGSQAGAAGVVTKPAWASVVCSPSTGACSIRVTVFKR